MIASSHRCLIDGVSTAGKGASALMVRRNRSTAATAALAAFPLALTGSQAGRVSGLLHHLHPGASRATGAVHGA